MTLTTETIKKLVPLGATTAGAILVSALCLASHSIPGFELFKRLEWITYDWRLRHAAESSAQVSTNLGFVFISDDSIKALLDGSLDYQAGLYWPRHVYGRVARELANQQAAVVGFDILLPNLRPDHPPATEADGTTINSDLFFARELRAAGNVVLAAERGVVPAPLFRTNAWELGDISAERESDGILRRTSAFREFHVQWHPLIRQAARVQGFDLRSARFHPDHISFQIVNHPEIQIPLANGKFNQVELYESLTGSKAPAGFPPFATPSTTIRVWDLGIVLAARILNLDLQHPRIEPERIVLTGTNGIQRTIPVDQNNRFYVDWAIRPTDPRLTKESIESLLDQERLRRAGETGLTNRWAHKAVIVGSIASGNDLTDLGATPLEKETYLTSRLWNVANSLLLNQFVHAPSLRTQLGISIATCLVVSMLTWRFRALIATALALTLAAAYVALALWLFVQHRIWIPIVFPFAGLTFTHFGLVTYRAVFEQKQHRHVKAVFAKIVSPNVVNELLSSDRLFLGGARREITVFFADIRGFTKLTDESQARAEDLARDRNLNPDQAAELFNQEAQELLNTVNLYLSLVADIIKKNDGTLDKYIGDCVMAFWGAPNPNPNHACSAVRCAIESQQAIAELNRRRSEENERILLENARRVRGGLPPLSSLQCLSLGTGINTGTVTVGLMGSHSHILNYTVFGRDVNLASRLEAFSAHDRIIIGQTTYRKLLQDDPALARTCTALEPTRVKGFRDPVKTFEVQWKPALVTPLLESKPGPRQAA